MNFLKEEPFKTKILREDFYDPKRDRNVPVKIYVPENAGNHLPCIFWSHGLGGGRDGAAFLGRFIAEQGFIVVHMTHIGTDTSIWEGKPGHPWDVIRAHKITRHVSMERFKDPSFVLNELKRRAEKGEAPYQSIDFNRVGMSGHSFGAVTTQIMAGHKLGKGKRLYSMRDERFKCGIPYSLGPTYNQTEPPEHIYGPISIPMLYMTGTEDSSPVSGKDYTTRLPIFESTTGPNQYLLVLKDGDHMVFAGSRGGLKDNPKRELHERLIQHISLVFWHAFLNENDKAIMWLEGSDLEEYIGDEAEWYMRNT